MSSLVLPNLVEPDSKITDDVTRLVYISLALNVPLTIKSFWISADPETTRPFLTLNSFAIID
jgi:hypothetical protein